MRMEIAAIQRHQGAKTPTERLEQLKWREMRRESGIQTRSQRSGNQPQIDVRPLFTSQDHRSQSAYPLACRSRSTTRGTYWSRVRRVFRILSKGFVNFCCERSYGRWTYVQEVLDRFAPQEFRSIASRTKAKVPCFCQSIGRYHTVQNLNWNSSKALQQNSLSDVRAQKQSFSFRFPSNHRQCQNRYQCAPMEAVRLIQRLFSLCHQTMDHLANPLYKTFTN